MNILWNNEKLNEKEQAELFISEIRKLFLSESGKVVLAVLLNDWFYFNAGDLNEKQQALRDYAFFFLEKRLGIELNTDFIDALADAAHRK